MVDQWKQAMDELRAVFERAQHDPDVARQLYRLCTGISGRPAWSAEARDMLLYVGVPADFLPSPEEIRDEPPAMDPTSGHPNR